MALYQQAHILLKQFLHNLNEEDWASRHVADREPDNLGPSAETISDIPVSSLSLALRQMGLVRQSPEPPARESISH